MGNCFNSNILNDIYIDYNIIDNKNNIVVGINYEHINSNCVISQYITIGNNKNINKIKFGIIHRCEKMVELYFENNIKLFLSKIDDDVKLTLFHNNVKLENYIDVHTIKKIKFINNNSDHLDLIYVLVHL